MCPPGASRLTTPKADPLRSRLLALATVLLAAFAAEGAASRSGERSTSAGPSAQSSQAEQLPSGRSGGYRTLEDYVQEMRDLATLNPDLVRPLVLPYTTFEGRSVEGIEITTDPQLIHDGKPVFLQLGLHHGREWPSGELALEWAYELIAGYRRQDRQLASLVRRTRTIIVPVVAPDSFNMSRTAGPDEHRRKNCRVPGVNTGVCPADSNVGVDINRNYAGLWAPEDPSSVTYGGPSPFSEPEARNVRTLLAERSVVTLVTNHTKGNEIIRPPGQPLSRPLPDARALRSMAAAMASENGYDSIVSGGPQASTYGVLDDWSYGVTGGFGFTFEIGDRDVHPPFGDVVKEYTGASRVAKRVGGGGNRAAYLIAQRSTANAKRHAVLRGTAPAGATLVASRRVRMPTWRGIHPDVIKVGPRFVTDRLSVKMVVPASGAFVFHLNPSRSPIAALGRRFRAGNDAFWALRCESADGMVQDARKVTVLRGQSKTLDLTAACTPG